MLMSKDKSFFFYASLIMNYYLAEKVSLIHKHNITFTIYQKIIHISHLKGMHILYTANYEKLDFLAKA